MGRIGEGGKIELSSNVMRACHWRPGTRIAFRAKPGQIIIFADAHSKHKILRAPHSNARRGKLGR